MNFFIVLITLLIIIICLCNVCLYFFIDKPSGPRGEKGEKGSKGPKGPLGDIGDRGKKGEKGTIGINGPNQGLKGQKGDIGPLGGRGMPGEDGFEGLRGYTGDKGPPGLQGNNGAPGKKGRIGKQGPATLFSEKDDKDIKLMAYKDKCITIKSSDNPISFKCPNNMSIFNFKASKISNYIDDTKIDEVTCCRFGLFNMTLNSIYSRTEILTHLGPKIAALKNEYTSIVKNAINNEEAVKAKKILNNLEIITKVLSQTDLVNKEYLYPTRLLFQLRDDKIFMEELEKFPKNNIEELENYLRIE